MRVIVFGGRTWGVYIDGKPKGLTVGEQQLLFYTLHGKGITEVIHGGAPGADDLGGQWARCNGVKETRVDADWDTHGRAAGPIRNSFMVTLKPDRAFGFPGGKGTTDMFKKLRAAGIPVDMAQDLREYSHAK